MLERRKHEDATRMVKMLERRVDEIQTEKVVIMNMHLFSQHQIAAITLAIAMCN